MNFATLTALALLQTPVNDTLLTDLAPGPASSNAGELLRASDFVLFTADANGSFQFRAWASDGTAAGTLALPPEGSFGTTFDPFAVLGDRALFYTRGLQSQGIIWYTTDGSAAGTAPFQVLLPNGTPVSLDPVSNPTLFKNRLFFGASVNAEFPDLWASDGTTAGTEQISFFAKGFFYTNIVETRAIGERLWYRAINSSAFEDSLYSTSGDPGAEVLELDPATQTLGRLRLLGGVGDRAVYSRVLPDERSVIESKLSGVDPVLLGVIDDRPLGFINDLSADCDAGLLLLRTSAAGDQDLVLTDGSTPGFTPLANFAGATSVFGWTPVPGGVGLFLEQPGGVELWFSDGTAGGTALAGSLPLPRSAVREVLSANADARVLFSVEDSPGSGRIWSGSPGGLVPIVEPAAQGDTGLGLGSAFSKDSGLAVLGDRALFVAETGAAGRELHSIPIEVTEGPTAVPLQGGCGPLLANAGNLIPGSTAALRLSNAPPGATSLWFRDTVIGATGALGACTIALPNPVFTAQVPTDGSGEGVWAPGLPTNPALVGQVIGLQVLAVEAGGPFLGIGRLSNALELTLAP